MSRSLESAISTPPFKSHYSLNRRVCQVKYFAYTKCEITAPRSWNFLLRRKWNEIHPPPQRFHAPSGAFHIAKQYFTHPKGGFRWKKHLRRSFLLYYSSFELLMLSNKKRTAKAVHSSKISEIFCVHKMWNNRSAVVKFSAAQKVKWNPPTAAAISRAIRRISHFEAIFHPPEGWISLKKALPKKCFFLAGTAGFGPANAGVKVPCLTAWLRPKISLY